MTCNRGKELLDHGSNEIGDRIPGYLNELGYVHISVSQNDRAHPACFKKYI